MWDEMAEKYVEPKITINGEELSVAEAMTVRVAICTFCMEIQDSDVLGDDPIGNGIRQGYLVASRSILQKILAYKKNPA
jgi:hypothetical protein